MLPDPAPQLESIQCWHLDIREGDIHVFAFLKEVDCLMSIVCLQRSIRHPAESRSRLIPLGSGLF